MTRRWSGPVRSGPVDTTHHGFSQVARVLKTVEDMERSGGGETPLSGGRKDHHYDRQEDAIGRLSYMVEASKSQSEG